MKAILGVMFILAAVALSFGYWKLIGNPSLYSINDSQYSELFGPAVMIGFVVYAACALQALLGIMILLFFASS